MLSKSVLKYETVSSLCYILGDNGLCAVYHSGIFWPFKAEIHQIGADFCEETDFVNSIVPMYSGGDTTCNYANSAGVDKQTYKG